MKRNLFILALLYGMVSGVYSSSAQSRIRYQADVVLGYSIGMGEFGTDRVNIHMINGVRFNKYLTSGIGIGADIYTNSNYPAFDTAAGVTVRSGTRTKSQIVIPVYINVRGYLPMGGRLSLLAGMDIGRSFGTSKYLKGGGFLCTPTAGFAINMNNGHAMSFAVGINFQRWKEKNYPYELNSQNKQTWEYNNNAFTLRLGYSF